MGKLSCDSVALIHHRLSSLSFERNIAPESAEGGRLTNRFKAEGVITNHEDGNRALCLVDMVVSGDMDSDSNDPQNAFRVSCQIEGHFLVRDGLDEDGQVTDAHVSAMAQYLFPVAAEMVESVMLKAGYGNGISLPRHASRKPDSVKQRIDK